MYAAIDMKSFYASVECVERGLDPLDTNLVVADEGRTEKTICLAVTPSLKAWGVSGRARLFEVISRVKEINRKRKADNKYREFKASSCIASELVNDSSLKLDFIIAAPRMAHYMETSSGIYGIYLRYVAPEDIHVYSIDEVFIDVAPYLSVYKCTAREFTMKIIREVLRETGITATAGIGTNIYLAKVAMDIVAKKIPADKDGVRIAELDEMSYRRQLWQHRPLTDFWGFGKGISARLERLGMYNMGDICIQSELNEEVLYREFGVKAELIIDHAWGWEPCAIEDIKSYVPENHSISQGQVLPQPYSFDKAMLICKEMADELCFELVRKGLVCNQVVLTVCYDQTGIPAGYKGKFESDRYGRRVPKPSHGSVNIGNYTSSARLVMEKTTGLFERITDSRLLVRRIYIVANHVISKECADEKKGVQFSLFDDVNETLQKQRNEELKLSREHSLQEAMVSIKSRFGKNAVLKDINFEKGSTAANRNKQVGGHRA